ncbi:MAG: hypothetical protein ACYSN7_04595, partial [Planctomycetota bacterium]
LGLSGFPGSGGSGFGEHPQKKTADIRKKTYIELNIFTYLSFRYQNGPLRAYCGRGGAILTRYAAK